MEYRQTRSFKRDYQGLDDDIKEIAKDKFLLFKEDMNHPSLRVKRMRRDRNIWEGHITLKYVFTFEIEESEEGGKIYWFRRIGDHSIYENP